MKLLQKGKVKLEVRFHCERTGCTALRRGGISKEIWNKIMSFKKTVLVLAFFSPSIAKFSEYFAHTQSYPSVKKKRVPFFQNSLWEAVRNQVYFCHLTSIILKFLWQPQPETEVTNIGLEWKGMSGCSWAIRE